MAVVEASVEVDLSLAETWDVFFDQVRWPSWVDGFAKVVADEGYPEEGGTLRWQSIPAGRGEVSERVLEHEHRRRHLIAFTDPATGGELVTTFSIAGEGTVVEQKLDYRLSERGPLSWLASVFFVKSQLRASMHRSLVAFKNEAEALE